MSCPLLSAPLMLADGTVDNSIVKQSANGGKVAVDNYGAACSAPVTACNPVLSRAMTTACTAPAELAPVLSWHLAVLQAAASCGPQQQL